MFCDAVVRDGKKRDRARDAKVPEADPTPESLMSHSFDRRSLLEELRGKGVRLTNQRRVLIEIIQSASEHLDITSLLERARARGATVDRATVYRTIELLKRHRLVDELDLMHLQGERHYYEARTRREHVHLACFQCGRIIEFATPLLDWLKLELAQRTGFEPKVVRLEVGGSCQECQEGRTSLAAT
jgi:Fur family transcriptional regulator, ferric uptake regulator